MRNLKLTIEYDGSSYYGWQIQKDKPTIQGKIKEALEKILRESVNIIGASRTDAGVHALGQVANFKTERNFPEEKLKRALNAILPHDIAIVSVDEVPLDFDSRRWATGKRYRYRIFNRDTPSPFEYKRSWFIPYRIDIESMISASKFLIGTHDFRSFSKIERGSGIETVRNISSIKIERKENVIEITFMGRSFLRHMIRVIVATLVEVGKGKLKPENVKEILEARDRKSAPFLAEPYGLYLERVYYEKTP